MGEGARGPSFSLEEGVFRINKNNYNEKKETNREIKSMKGGG